MLHVRTKPEMLSQWLYELQQQFPGGSDAVHHYLSRIMSCGGAGTNAQCFDLCINGLGFFVLFPGNQSAGRVREAFNVGRQNDPTDSDLLLELVTLHRSKLRA